MQPLLFRTNIPGAMHRSVLSPGLCCAHALLMIRFISVVYQCALQEHLEWNAESLKTLHKHRAANWRYKGLPIRRDLYLVGPARNRHTQRSETIRRSCSTSAPMVKTARVYSVFEV